MPLALVPLLPALLLVLPVWAVLLRLAERRDQPVTERPTLQHLETVANYEDFGTQNPFAVVGFIKPGLLRLADHPRGDVPPELCGPARVQRRRAWPG